MALSKQNVPISFLKGIDTKSDSKQVVVGKLLLLENGIFTNPGKIRKRFGRTNIASLSNGTSIASYLNELVAFDGFDLFSYSESNSLMTNKGPITSLELSLTQVVRNSYQQTVPDMAQHSSGLQIFTWEDSRGGSRYSIVDSFTGESLVQDKLLSTDAHKPKPFALGAYFVIIFNNTANNHLQYVSIQTTTPSTQSAATDIAIDLDVTNPNFDCAMVGSRLFIAYNNSSGGGGISLRYMNFFLVLSAALAVNGDAADVCLAVIGDQIRQQVWVAFYTGTTVKYFIRDYNLTLVPVLATTTVEIVANIVRIEGQVSDGSGQFWYEQSAVLTYNTLIRTATATSLGVVGTPAVFLRSVGIAGKTFVYLGVVYLTATYSSVQQPTYFVVSQDGRVISKGVQGNGGGLLTTSAVPEAVQPTTGSISLPILQKDLLTTVSGTIYTQTGMSYINIDFLGKYVYQRATLAKTLHITGGLLEMYDGANVVEHGFNVYPEEVTGTSSTVGGNLGSTTVATQYQYRVTYEWTDNQGQIHRSFPSIPDSNTTFNFAMGVNTGQVTLTIPTLRLTDKEGVRIVVYRTEGNGTIFYQVTSTTSPLFNNTAVDSVSFNDTQADASIIGNPLLYTTGGVLGNNPVPASILTTFYKDRLVVVPADNRFSFWYSKQVVPGQPVEFSDFFVKNVDQRGGNITGVAPLDDKLVIFKETLIFAMTGDGPDSTGAQNDFSEPQLVSTDGGNIDPNSIVLFPYGLMYKSLKGIYIVDRSLSVAYIGADVEAFNSFDITSAQLITDTNQVRFTLDNGKVLVYDYYMQQWSVFTNQNAIDSCVFQNNFTYIQPNGQIMQETPNMFNDNGEFIRLRLTTSWLSMAGLQGFQRVYRFLLLGEYLSPHQLLIGISYDFDSTFYQQELIDASTLFTRTTYGEDSPYGDEEFYGGRVPNYEFRIDFRRQTCTSVQMTIEDVQNMNFGEGLSLSGFNLMVGAKVGSNKVPAIRAFG